MEAQSPYHPSPLFRVEVNTNSLIKSPPPPRNALTDSVKFYLHIRQSLLSLHVTRYIMYL